MNHNWICLMLWGIGKRFYCILNVLEQLSIKYLENCHMFCLLTALSWKTRLDYKYLFDLSSYLYKFHQIKYQNLKKHTLQAWINYF